MQARQAGWDAAPCWRPRSVPAPCRSRPGRPPAGPGWCRAAVGCPQEALAAASPSHLVLCVWGVQPGRFANLANNLPKWYNLVRHGYKAPDPRLFQHRPTACCETASRFVVSAAAVAPPPSPPRGCSLPPNQPFPPPTYTHGHSPTYDGWVYPRQHPPTMPEHRGRRPGDGWWLQEKSGGRLALRVTSRLLPRAS